MDLDFKITEQNIISEFQKLGIPIFTSGHRDFELSVATPNFLYRFDRPVYVVRPRNGEDVAITVRAANSLRFKITVKNGGHSYAGFSNAAFTGSNRPRSILLDMLDMKAVTITDSGSGKIVTCSAGALWADVYRELASDSDTYNGWLANGGRCPAVGVAGFILGGGFGPFSRGFGLGADQLREVDFVTVSGETITVNSKKRPRLFWALRGAGGGMFGIVTRLRIQLSTLGCDKVVAGRLSWSVYPDTLPAFKDLMTDFYQAKWDNRCTIDATWECDLSRSTDRVPYITRFLPYYDGLKGSFDAEIDAKLKSSTSTPENPEPEIYGNVREQLKRRSIEEPSTLFLHETLWSQWAEETRRSRPTDRAYTLYSSWVIKNDNRDKIRAMIDTITKRIDRFRQKFTGERGTFAVACIHVGGNINLKKNDETAYPWREGNYSVYILVRWHEKWLYTEMKAFFEITKQEMKQYAIDEIASYVNFPDRFLVGWAQAYYGKNLPRLRRLYRQWVTDRVSIYGGNPLLFEQSFGNLVGPSRPPPESSRNLVLGQGRGSGTTEESAEKRQEEEEEEEEEEDIEELEADETAHREREEEQKAQDTATTDNFWNNLYSKWSYYVPPEKSYEDYAHIASGLPRC